MDYFMEIMSRPLIKLPNPNDHVGGVTFSNSVEYKAVIDQLRPALVTDDESSLALQRTEDAVRLQPQNYVAWSYRLKLLGIHRVPLSSELDFLTNYTLPKLTLTNCKSYQTWSYRMSLLESHSSRSLRTASHSAQGRQRNHSTPVDSSVIKNEMSLLLDVLLGARATEREYHVWSYRQWLVSRYGLNQGDGSGGCDSREGGVMTDEMWKDELTFVDHLLMQNPSNNSAWHHRFVVLWELGKVREALGPSDERVALEMEIQFVQSKLAQDPHNKAGWNYLSGILERTGTPLSIVLPFVQSLVGRAEHASVPALCFLAEVYDSLLSCHDPEAKIRCRSAAIETWTRLVECDPLRARYWAYRRDRVKE